MSQDYSPKRSYILRASTADAAANITGTTQKNGHYYKGLRLSIVVSAFTGTSVTFTIEGLDPITGGAYTLLAAAAITASSTTPVPLLIYPGAIAVTNVVLNQTLPIWWRIKTTGTYTVCTSSVYAELIP